MNSLSCYVTKSVICIPHSPLYSMSVWAISEKCTPALVNIKDIQTDWQLTTNFTNWTVPPNPVENCEKWERLFSSQAAPEG